MNSFYVISKEGNGPLFAKGDCVDFMYTVTIPCNTPSTEACRICHEGKSGAEIEKDRIFVKIGDYQLHKFIEDTLMNGTIRHGSDIRFYLTPDDAFADVGSDDRVQPNSALCFKLVELSWDDLNTKK